MGCRRLRRCWQRVRVRRRDRTGRRGALFAQVSRSPVEFGGWDAALIGSDNAPIGSDDAAVGWNDAPLGSHNARCWARGRSSDSREGFDIGLDAWRAVSVRAFAEATFTGNAGLDGGADH